jgi:hypothetical protein
MKLYNDTTNKKNIEEREERLEMSRRAKRHRIHQIELLDANNQQAVINLGEHDIGNMCYKCEYCNERCWRHESSTLNKYTKCCHNGEVSLNPLFETPTLL